MTETVELSAFAMLHRALALCESLGIVQPGQALRIKAVLRECEGRVRTGSGS